MKKKLLPLFVMVTVLAAGCKKEVPTDCLKAKIVRVTCASIVMQALNNDSIGEDGWKDMYGNKATYDNVFTVSNPCHIASEHRVVGNTVYIKIAKPTKNDCVVCALYDAPPKVSYDVTSIGQLPCGNESPKQ